MVVKVNGENRDVSTGITLLELIESFERNPQRVVVELNAEVIMRDDFKSTVLKENDAVELIEFVAGG